MKDDLGDRMKRDYEDRTRFLLPRRTYTLLRIDGKAFHRYTRDCARPYDLDLMADMDAATIAVCERIDGIVFHAISANLFLYRKLTRYNYKYFQKHKARN